MKYRISGHVAFANEFMTVLCSYGKGLGSPSGGDLCPDPTRKNTAPPSRKPDPSVLNRPHKIYPYSFSFNKKNHYDRYIRPDTVWIRIGSDPVSDQIFLENTDLEPTVFQMMIGIRLPNGNYDRFSNVWLYPFFILYKQIYAMKNLISVFFLPSARSQTDNKTDP